MKKSIDISEVDSLYFMGVGEQVDDLILFNLDSYIKGLILTETEAVND